MEEISSTELQNTIQDLSTGSLNFVRLRAANRLGELSVSNGEIVQALAIAVSHDEDANVRTAAMQALLSPAHQAFLKDHPDFFTQVTKTAGDVKAREKASADIAIMDEFSRRRTRERISLSVMFVCMAASTILLIVGASQLWMKDWIVRVWQIVFVGFAVVYGLLSWRNWRCPACDSWLGGFTFTINAFFSADFIRCPKCGVRLH